MKLAALVQRDGKNRIYLNGIHTTTISAHSDMDGHNSVVLFRMQ